MEENNVEEEKYKRIVTISIVIAVIVVMLNYPFSMILMLTGIGELYIVLFRYLNLKLIKKFDKFKFTKVLFYISCITLVLGCMFLPMYDDASNYYILFVLVKNRSVMDMFGWLDYVLLTINIITIILELIINIVGFIVNRRNKNNIEEYNTDEKKIICILRKKKNIKE